MTHPVLPLSGDPPTLGHRNLVERAAGLFGDCTVVLARNAGKSPVFTVEERKRLCEATFAGIPNVAVEICDGLLADWCFRRGVRLLVRGIRGGGDVEGEVNLAWGHRRQVPDIETVYLPAFESLAHVSSSLARIIAAEQGDLRGLVSMPVKEAMEAAMHGQFRLCVTGPIACGKSTLVGRLAAWFAERRVPCEEIDMDRVTEDIYRGTDAGVTAAFTARLTESFGAGVLGDGGQPDKNRVRQAVLSDKSGNLKKSLADAIREPLEISLRSRLRGRKGLLLLAAAVAAEGDWIWHSNNHVLLVKADPAVQLERLMGREKIDRDEAARRLEWSGTAERKAELIRDIQKRDRAGTLIEVDTTTAVEGERLAALGNQILELFPKLKS